MTDQLFPREPRRMRQPKKKQLRDELARAAERIERLETENEQLRLSWWRRLMRRKAA